MPMEIINYKKILISSEQEANAHLLCWNKKISGDLANDPPIKNGYADLEIKTARPPFYLLADFKIGISQNSLKIRDIGVYGDVAERGHGPFLTKGALAVAKTYNAVRVDIQNIVMDGWWFWPSIGAEPAESSSLKAGNVEAKIFDFRIAYRSLLELHEQAHLQRIEETAKKRGDQEGWHVLAADRNLKLLYKKNILQSICNGNDMVIDFSNPYSMDALSRKLGKLPALSLVRPQQKANKKYLHVFTK